MNRQDTSRRGSAWAVDTVDPLSPSRVSGSRSPSWLSLFAAIWPIHRAILLGCLGAAALLALGLVVFRQWAVGAASDVIAGPACRAGAAVDSESCVSALYRARPDWSRVLELLLTAACPVLALAGALILGVAAFSRDFEQRTQVFQLTQSVSRLRWWAAKTLLILVPWAVAMLGLGAVASWTFPGMRDAFAPTDGYPSDPMSLDVFYLTALGLFVVGTVAVCTGVTAGILLRNTLGAILVAGLVTAALVVGAELARPHLVPVDRFTSDYGSYDASTPTGSWQQRSGLLDASGRVVEVWAADCSDLYDQASAVQAPDEAMSIDRQCAARNGIVANYSDVIVPACFGLLRLLWSGGLLAASALLLLGGLLRVRRGVL